MRNTILVKNDNFLFFNTENYTKQKIDIEADKFFIFNNKHLILKDKKLNIYENNKSFLFSDGIDDIIKEKDYVVLIKNNIISILNKDFKEINKHIIPQKSIVLYCDDKNLIYSSNHKLFLVSNNIIEFPFYSNALYYDNGIIYYYHSKRIFSFNIKTMKVFNYINIDIDEVKSIKINDGKFFISCNSGLFIINFRGKVEKIFKNIELIDFVDVEINEEIKEKIDLSIVLTCHDKYLEYLPDCVKSIDNQNIELKDKIIVLDRCSEENINFSGWDIYYVNFGHPNKSRNFGMSKTNSKWIIFFDADNMMPADYLSSFDLVVDDNISVIYKNILIRNKNTELKNPFCREWDYWFLREANYIDTSSVWRKDSIINIGGWDENIDNEDDYNLILRLSRVGWKGKFSNNLPYSEHNSDHIGRWASNKDKINNSLFNSYDFSIVSLLSGRDDIYEEWINAIKQIDLPKYIDFIILDDSHNKQFNNRLKEIYSFDCFNSVNIIKSPYEKKDIYSLLDKHKVVANLYNYIIPTINTDFILTIEDDVIVPKNIMTGLFSMFQPRHVNINDNKIFAGISGLYQSPSNKTLAALSTNMKEWKEIPTYNEMINIKKEVGFIGGGCSLWLNSALKKCFPLQPEMKYNKLYGWDSDLCNKLRELNYLIGFNGEVICNHKVREVFKM